MFNLINRNFSTLGVNMFDLIRGAWTGLDAKGRTVLIICVALVIIAAMAYGVDLPMLERR